MDKEELKEIGIENIPDFALLSTQFVLDGKSFQIGDCIAVESASQRDFVLLKEIITLGQGNLFFKKKIKKIKNMNKIIKIKKKLTSYFLFYFC